MGKDGEGKKCIFLTCPRYRSLEVTKSNCENERPEKRNLFPHVTPRFFYWFQYGTVGDLLESTT